MCVIYNSYLALNCVLQQNYDSVSLHLFIVEKPLQFSNVHKMAILPFWKGPALQLLLCRNPRKLFIDCYCLFSAGGVGKSALTIQLIQNQ